MPGWTLDGMIRMCGALNKCLLAEPFNIKVNNKTPALEGDKDTHNLLGQLINVIPHNVMVGGIPAIPSIVSMANPDVLGIIPHVKGFPIPIMGSQNVIIGMGSYGAALGIMQQLVGGGFGALQIGELVSVAGQILGTVSNFTQIGGGAAVAQFSGLQGGVSLSPGTAIYGQTSGHYLIPVIYVDGRSNTYPALADVTNAVVTDSGDYIVLQTYEDYYPAINLTSSVVTT